MRSIRLSLLVYFLLLLTAGLGVASLLAYNIIESTLRAREEAASALVKARYEELCQEARTQIYERMLATARSLAGRVRPRFRGPRDSIPHTHSAVLGMLGANLAPNAHMLAPQLWWLAQGYPYRDSRGWPRVTDLQTYIWRRDLVILSLGDEVELDEDHKFPRISWYIQTNNWGMPLPPRGELNLPDEADFAPEERVYWEPDEIVLPDGHKVCRVRFRTVLTLQDGGWPAPPPRRGGGGVASSSPRPGSSSTSGSFGSNPRSKELLPKPALIIQCAARASDLEESLIPFREQRDEDLARIRSETAESLRHQRQLLLLIFGLTFGATVLGCVGLVWLGLLPLHRLSDAVSEISPKNFTLAINAKQLPTELQPIAERLEATLDQLKRAFAREKQATADISHELRTPLAALLTTLELALRRDRSAEQYREMLQECHTSATHMHQIVERLLTLARLDAGVDRLRARVIDVSDLAEQCATVVRPLAEARGLRLSVVNACPSQRDNEPFVHTDPDKLREVLSNLLHNAIQYNRPQGAIDLVVGRENGQVCVEVRDTGIGIAPEAKDRIFERFYRADPSRACDGLNAGLGLAIVKEYVDLMGGRISVESAPGQGSTFRVELPVHSPASAA